MEKKRNSLKILLLLVIVIAAAVVLYNFLGSRTEPVSYTHLDVYKRQILLSIFIINHPF